MPVQLYSIPPIAIAVAGPALGGYKSTEIWLVLRHLDLHTTPLHCIQTIIAYYFNHHLVHLVGEVFQLLNLIESHNGIFLSLTKDILRQFVEQFHRRVYTLLSHFLPTTHNRC